MDETTAYAIVTGLITLIGMIASMFKWGQKGALLAKAEQKAHAVATAMESIGAFMDKATTYLQDPNKTDAEFQAVFEALVVAYNAAMKVKEDC